MMKLSLYLVLTGRVGAEFIQFGNQTEFNKLQQNVRECNEILYLNYSMSATSEGYWAVYQYRKKSIDEESLKNFMNCVDPDSKYPVVFENRSDPHNPAWTDRGESVLGPDHVFLTAEPTTMGNIEDLKPEEVKEEVKEEVDTRPKRLAAQDFYFYWNNVCTGVQTWSGYAKNRKCITISQAASRCVTVHNKGCCESSTILWPHFSCQLGDAWVVKVLGGKWRSVSKPAYSFRQVY